MTPAGHRLMAQFRQEPPIELARLPAGQYFAESAVRSMTSEMSLEWRTWIDSPMRDHDAIGRMVPYTPGHHNQKRLGRPPDNPDSDLEVETFTSERVDLAPAEV